MSIVIGDTSFTRRQGYVTSYENSPRLGGKESAATGSENSNDPVRLSLSPDAERFMKNLDDKPLTNNALKGKSGSLDQRKDQVKSGKSPKNERLSESEQKMVDDLQKRDREVRTHEAAHAATAGSYAVGGPNYEFQQGPDGKNYAVGGHVKLDMKPESTPEATITKMQTIRRAALAPADPSGADRSVAAAAAKLEMDARQELNETSPQNSSGNRKDEKENSSTPKRITVKDGLYGSADRLNKPGGIMDQIA
jgi:hypothetical protein